MLVINDRKTNKLAFQTAKKKMNATVIRLTLMNLMFYQLIRKPKSNEILESLN